MGIWEGRGHWETHPPSVLMMLQRRGEGGNLGSPHPFWVSTWPQVVEQLNRPQGCLGVWGRPEEVAQWPQSSD